MLEQTHHSNLYCCMATLCLVCGLIFPLNAQAEPVQQKCVLAGVVAGTPKEVFTKIKNDGRPMIHFNFRVERLAKTPTAAAKSYCQSLLGKEIEVYLSAAALNEVPDGGSLILLHRHNSGREWPYWPNWFHLEKEGD